MTNSRVTNEKRPTPDRRIRRLLGYALAVSFIVTGVVGTIDESLEARYDTHQLPVLVAGPALIILGGIISFVTGALWKPHRQSRHEKQERQGPIRWGWLSVTIALRIISIPLLMLPAYGLWGMIDLLIGYFIYAEPEDKMGASRVDAPIYAVIMLVVAWLGGICLLARPGRIEDDEV